MNEEKVRAIIDRGPGNVQHFDGYVAGETTTHVLVRTSMNPLGEWFARSSPPAVHVTFLDERHLITSR